METKQSSALDKVVTVHNTADREIIQHFGDESVKIVTDIETKKDRPVCEWCAKISDN